MKLLLRFLQAIVLKFLPLYIAGVAGVPYWHGAVFEPAMFPTPGQETAVGLFFRSYAYQIQFRRLNPWNWADQL